MRQEELFKGMALYVVRFWIPATWCRSEGWTFELARSFLGKRKGRFEDQEPPCGHERSAFAVVAEVNDLGEMEAWYVHKSRAYNGKTPKMKMSEARGAVEKLWSLWHGSIIQLFDDLKGEF